MKGLKLTALSLVAFSGLAGSAMAGPSTDWRFDRSSGLPLSLSKSPEQLRVFAINPFSGMIETGSPGDPGPLAMCFDRDNPPSLEVIQQVNAIIAAGFGSRYNIGARWAGNPGDPIALTWSFVPDTVSINDGGLGGTQNSVLFARLDTQFAALGGRTRWVGLFESCFARWQALSGITYTRIRATPNDWDDGAAWGATSSATRGAIRIGMKNSLDGAGGVLAYNSFPTNGDMVLDGAENWGGSSANNWRFFRNVILHEHGHGLGFSHVCPANDTKLMEPFISTAYDGPQHDDVRAVQDNYGDPFEIDNTVATANPIDGVAGGAQDPLVPGQTVAIGTVPSPAILNTSTLSLDADGEQDWFSFLLTDSRLVNITVTPLGLSYTDVDQNANGTCQTSGNVTNSLTQMNLAVSAFASNGTTLYRTQDANPAGQNEVITGLLFNAAGGTIRVFESSTGGESQLYTMSVVVQNVALTTAATNGTFTDRVDVTWSSIPDATNYRVLRNIVDDPNTAEIFDAGVVSTWADTTAVPGQQYFYWVRGAQTGSVTSRFLRTASVVGRRNAAPVANAGLDITVTDTDNTGSEVVALNGSGSSDSDGTITNYRWNNGATILGQGASPTLNVNFLVGTYTLTLTVTDNNGATASDTVNVTVAAGTPPCPADWDGNGELEPLDIQAFFIDYRAGEADFDGNGETEPLDIQSFFAAYRLGC